MLKYFTVVPVVLMFMVTTNPSELAASMNRLGISYNIGYSIAIALRYVPDVQADFSKIKHAQEARGIRKCPVRHPFQTAEENGKHHFPVDFSSMDRIDVVSNAMELRGFGKNKREPGIWGKTAAQ